MELFCPCCKELPLIKMSFISKGNIMAIINCKCGKKFHDFSTLIAQYTNILQNNNQINQRDSKEKIKSDKNLIYFCETCFKNIYHNDNVNDKENVIKSQHHNHILIKIDKDIPTITDEEFEKVTKNLKKVEEKVKKYLPELRDMLLDDCKKKNDKVEVEYLAFNNLFTNNLLLKFLKLIYDLYKTNKESHTLTYQIIQNLKFNSDYNLNKYNLDIKNIKKERFISFLKSSLIICCNPFINKTYQNLMKEKEQLLKIIKDLKPIKEVSKDDTPLKVEEMMKSNSTIYFGEKSKINNLAHGRGILICENGSHYFGYFKNDYFQEGFGKSINKDGNIYFGEYKEGLANGYGKFTTKSGNEYIGNWVKSKLDGFCYISYDNKDQVYCGEVKKGLFNGFGELNYNKRGIILSGKFKDGKMDGIGKIIYKNIKEYLGEFKEGNKNGYGIMQWPSEEKYEGLWENDSFKFGKYSWPNGNVFFGNFQDDSVNGFGTFYNGATGVIETGMWSNGKRVDINHRDVIPSTRYLSFL